MWALPSEAPAPLTYGGQVNPEAIKDRSKTLRDLSKAKRRAFASRYLGKTVEVLFEQQDATFRHLFGLLDYEI